MKFATIIFFRMLSGCYQQKLFSSEKKNSLAASWNEAMKAEDTDILLKLLTEITFWIRSPVWLDQIEKAKESIITQREE